MLVLSRKAGERIRIGDNITIVVNRVVGSRVSVGIEAPADVRIVRGELDFFTEDRPARVMPGRTVAPAPKAVPAPLAVPLTPHHT